VTLVLLLATAAMAVYQPGEPGAPWSQRDVEITKGKISWIISGKVAGKKALTMVDGGEEALEGKFPVGHIIPTLPNLIRLSFHDCLKYESGGGGCDGCLNFDGMGRRVDKKKGMTFEERSVADNNNLLWVAQVLEGVYKDPNFGPDNIEHFDKSLFDRGMSRADLWAFAGIVALQTGIKNNNDFCEENIKDQTCNLNKIDCSITSINENIESIFKTGRSDCNPTDSEVACDAPNNKYAFCTKKSEVKPSPHQNGTTTAEFFKENFNLNPKEAVTLMGAHTFGAPKASTSGFRRYGWTASGQQAFNSAYYQNIVRDQGYKMDQRGGGGGYGDAFGNPISYTWQIRSEGSNHQWNWSLHGDQCNDVACGLKEGEESPYMFDDYDGPCNSCCRINREARLLPFRSVQMMSVDMGLYRKFTINPETLKPQGCPGFANCKNYLEKKNAFCSFPGAIGATGCERNDEPATEEQSMADVVEEYATDFNAFAKDFVAVYEKMQANGYDNPLTAVD